MVPKSTSQLFYGMSLNFVLSDIFLWLDSGYTSLTRESQKWLCVLPFASCQVMYDWFIPYRRCWFWLLKIVSARWLHYSSSFSLVINKYFVKRYLKLHKDSIPYLNSYYFYQYELMISFFHLIVCHPLYYFNAQNVPDLAGGSPFKLASVSFWYDLIFPR